MNRSTLNNLKVLVRGQTGSVDRYWVARRGASTSVTLTLKYDFLFKVRAFQLSKLHNFIDFRGVLSIWQNRYIYHSILNVKQTLLPNTFV